MTGNTTIGFIGSNIPKIIVSKLAHTKMNLYIHGVSTEIGWLGAIEKLESGDFYISDVFLLEQEVHSTNTTITEDGQSNFIMELIQNDKKHLLDKIKFWGHSHVNMSVSPSAQDDDTLEQLKPDVDPDFFLRGIFNKRGEAKYTLYYYTHGIVLDNVKWELENIVDEELASAVKAEIKQKVTNKTVVYQRPAVVRHSGGHFSHLNKRFNNVFKGRQNELLSDDEIDEIDEIDDIEDQYLDDNIADEEWMNNFLNEGQQ